MNLKEILYPQNIKVATRIQAELRSRVALRPLNKKPALIAAVDSAFSHNLVLAAAALFSFPELELLDATTVKEPLNFPYRSGYLSFCEGPAIYLALKKFKTKPDVLICDGQGIAHPRRLGLATFMGIVTGIPSIGCAKSLLVGSYQEPGIEKGCYSELYYRGEVVGYVLRTRTGVKPVFVSPGHLVSLEDSLEIIKGCLTNYRIPEPQRQAHQLTQKLKLQNQ
ncbi:MAG: endonuclease V [Candidatus Saccharicenans sp.]|nr:MAG: endonuclease V [Candidatus Aminicenantes bacterium]HEK85181.1 endonuclease V [Candidatus Aminicenantes bacterium]